MTPFLIFIIMRLKSLNTLIFVIFFVLLSNNLKAQVSVQTFIDPCTKEVTMFTVPLQGGTTIFFLNKSQYFTASDIASGAFTSWVNQTYLEYRQTNPCSQQQGQVTQNQITSQIIGNTIQSVVGSIMSSAQSTGGNLNAGGDNKKDEKKESNKNSNGSGNNGNGSGSSSQGGENGGQPQSSSGTNGSTGGTNSSQGSSTGTQGGNSTGSNNPTQGGSGSSQPPVGGSGGSSGGTTTGGSSGSGSSGGTTTGGSSGSGSSGNSSESSKQSSEEVGATTVMNNDAHNDKGGESGGGGKSGGKGGSKSGSSNPMIVSSDFTTAQNLDKSFTPILNLGLNRSSMTGLSSYGATAMIWFNFKQFAISAKYTKLNFNKKNTLKYIHNVNLTGVYTYGNILGFLGYSGILNAGKWGVTGFNVSAAVSIVSEDKSGYYSPSITAFYTRPFKVGKRIILSPELYMMSTPLVYSTKDKVTVTDRFFSAFVGTGIDYQISKRFKLNMNYKANLSSNPDVPILSFFLIGSKVNL